MSRFLLSLLVAALCVACSVEQKNFDLDPRPHRDSMQGIENLLYAPHSPKMETTKQIVDMAGVLAASLDAGRPPGPSKKAAEAVRTWSSTIAVQGEVGYVMMDVPKARKSWQAMRDANFRPEPFFKVAGADLDDLQKSRTGRVDAMQLTLITLVAGELASVLERGRMDTEAFAEIGPDVSADSAEATAAISEWSEWVDMWERKLGSVDWPGRPPLAAEEVGAIYQQLKEVEKSLIAVVAPHESGVTPKAARNAGLAEAGKHLDAAKARLDALRE